jgi:CubicO group peptidase (beta-lactamase class C family)
MRSPAHSALPALLALALGAGSAHAQLAPWCGPPAAARTVGVPSPALVARVDSVVQPLMAGARVPGLAVAVAVDGVVRWERAYGYADLEQCVPVTRFTMFRLASVSKPVTAIAALQLAEQRKLDLDAPIQRLVPEFPETPTPITVRQLLAHTSGIRHYRGDEAMSTRQYASLASALAIFAGDSLVHPPGTAYAYSTYGYTLLGLAVERAAGQPFLEQLRTRVLEPAGVSALRDDAQQALVPRRARGYARDASGAVGNAAFLNSSYKVPGGGMVATVGDVARIGAALSAGRLVLPGTFRQMSAPVRTGDGREHPYGLGLAVGGIPGGLPGAVWHGGAQQGTSTVLYMLPEDGVVVAVLTNLEGLGGALVPATDRIARIVRESAIATRAGTGRGTGAARVGMTGREGAADSATSAP